MYNQPYFIPNYMSNMAAPSMMRGLGGAMRGLGAASTPLRAGAGASAVGRGLGLMGRLGSGLSAFRSINWTGLINNASKTLGIVNQAIPLVKQVGPMVNNVKSMIKIASVFKDETDHNSTRRINSNTRSSHQNSSAKNTDLTPSSLNKTSHQKEQDSRTETITNHSSLETDNSPTFFIPT